jgi:thiol-disulfide isomerase/thioredoxin
MDGPTDGVPRQRRWPMLVVTGLIVLVLAFVAWDQRPWNSSRGAGAFGMSSDETPRRGGEAPDFTLQNERGESVSLSDFKGRPVFLNFWATWCTFCKEEMPDMQQIQDLYGDELVVIGVNAGDSVEDGEAFARRAGISYLRLYDRDLDVTDGYLVRAMPTSYFITADGEIWDANFGFLVYDQMVEFVDGAFGRRSE